MIVNLISIKFLELLYISGSATLKDNPRQDAFGPLAKDLKINTLRTYVKKFYFVKNYFNIKKYFFQKSNSIIR